jgi:hypothetical protein
MPRRRGIIEGVVFLLSSRDSIPGCTGFRAPPRFSQAMLEMNRRVIDFAYRGLPAIRNRLREPDRNTIRVRLPIPPHQSIHQS